MPRACTLCSYHDQAAVRAAFASGLSDRKIAKRFRLSHPAVGHHRREHMLRPQAVAIAAPDNGVAQGQQRRGQFTAIEQGDPVAAFSKPSQLDKLTVHEQQLSRLFDRAEAEGAIGAATQIKSQQLKAVEIGSRIAQTGGYGAPPRVVGDAGTEPRWSITFEFPNAGKVETFTLKAAPEAADANRRGMFNGIRDGPAPGIVQEIDVPHEPPTIDGAISPEIERDLVERLAYRPAPDEQAED